MNRTPMIFALALSSACGDVASEEEARIAYLGIDTVIVRALALGFDGFNAADNANIPPQAADGDEAGTIGVSGQVDQGSSDNKGMRLAVVLTEYAEEAIDDPETEDEEEIAIVYSTAEDAPLDLDMSLRDIPDGTLTGTLAGTVLMEGDLAGELEVSLTFAGETDADGAGGTERADGTTAVTGTATSAAGTFDVDVEI